MTSLNADERIRQILREEMAPLLARLEQAESSLAETASAVRASVEHAAAYASRAQVSEARARLYAQRGEPATRQKPDPKD